MTTDNTKKINTGTVKRLNSEDSNVALKAIGELRESGNAAYIPCLIEVLHATDDAEIKSNISRLLSELKHRDTVPFMIEAIENEKYAGIRGYLVSACWENGLDYSASLPLFTDLVTGNDLLVAFEAYTVITNMSGKISKAVLDQERKKIKEAMVHADEQKKALLHDLVHFLPAFEEGIEPQAF